MKEQLTNTGIDVSLWGTGEAKTLAHLQREIESGETTLVVSEAGELLRKLLVGTADIYYQSPDGKKYRLKEDRQIFKDGRERQRSFGQAISEKMKPDEDPQTAMIRGIWEELGISSKISLTEIGVDEEKSTSPSYPGLKTQYICHRFQAVLTDEQFNPQGYEEEQDDLNTYFVWEEAK